MSSLVRTEPLYDQVYEVLWERILSQEMAPGARLRDVEWAEKLQVSRTPVREAFRKLQKDGVLEPAGHGRYSLKRISPKELRALYRCRAALEGLAIRDLGPRASAAEIEALRQLVRDTGTCISDADFSTAFKLNTEFHARLTALSDNFYLLLLLDNLRRLILYARSSLRTMIDGDSPAAMYAAHLGRTQEDHLAILDAIDGQDFERAGTLMERHLFQTAEDMSSIVEQAALPGQ